MNDEVRGAGATCASPVKDKYQIRDVVKRVASGYPDVECVGLFGSFSRDEQRDSSDVDLVVALGPAADYRTYSSFKFDLEDALGRPVDLISSLDGLAPFFMDELRRDTVRIYEL